MDLVEKTGVSYLRCDSCQSVWIREPELRSLLDQARPGADNGLLVHNDGTKRRSCPTCRERMDIAWLLFLQMDRCAKHGVWLDPGELERALAGDIGKEVLAQVTRQVKGRKEEEQQRRRGQRMTEAPRWMQSLRNYFR